MFLSVQQILTHTSILYSVLQYLYSITESVPFYVFAFVDTHSSEMIGSQTSLFHLLHTSHSLFTQYLQHKSLLLAEANNAIFAAS